VGSDSGFRVFGIRHHGPGCARSLLVALDAMKPDMILVEGPPDAAEVLPLISSEDMRPPVAMLVYRPDEPGNAVFYPFAEFSPEWQTLRFAAARGIPSRFIDLPQAHRMAHEESPAESDDELDAEPEPAREDPIGALANAAGFSDGELWWEHEIERRRDPAGLFEGIIEAMKALRESLPDVDADENELREAFMRQCIRAALKEGHANIAVVCGAWHAPALAELGPAKRDAERLKGLTKTKTVATWIPWTTSRLSYRSGYGAGVSAPGFYQHLWTAPQNATLSWSVRAARTLRDEDLPASTANVVESVRLAEALAALRGLAAPGLAEINESLQAVLCGGAAAPLALVRDRLEIGTELGRVPKEAPAVPLRRELEVEEKRLRLKRSDEIKTLDLDLRDTSGRERSRLLHRLLGLNVPWGRPQQVSGKAGTFHEVWQIRWQPEMEVALIEASRWGSTIAEAAAKQAIDEANGSGDIDALTGLLDRVVVAELDAAIGPVLLRLQARAALAADVKHMAAALPRLAKLARYGDVRGLDAKPVLAIADGIYERALVGLPVACVGIDEDAASGMVTAMSQIHEAVGLLDPAESASEVVSRKAQWLDVLAALAANDTAVPLVRGYATRLCHEAGRIDREQLHTLASRSLSRAVEPPAVAAWLEGLLRGGALLLMHGREIWAVLDEWLAGLDTAALDGVLPLLRRAFSAFESPERRAMGELVAGLRRGTGRSSETVSEAQIDQARAALVMPVLAHILGVELPGAKT
jgi:hypothetical protein